MEREVKNCQKFGLTNNKLCIIVIIRGYPEKKQRKEEKEMKHELKVFVREVEKDGVPGYETKIEGEGVSAEMMVNAMEHLTDCFLNNFVESEEN